MPFKCIKHKLSPKLRYVSCRTATAKTRVVYTRSCKNFATLRGLLSGNWRYMASFTPSPAGIRRSFPLFPFSQTIENLISLSIYKFLFLTGSFRRFNAPTSHRHATNTKPDLCQCYPLNIASQLHSAKKGDKRRHQQNANIFVTLPLRCVDRRHEPELLIRGVKLAFGDSKGRHRNRV